MRKILSFILGVTLMFNIFSHNVYAYMNNEKVRGNEIVTKYEVGDIITNDEFGIEDFQFYKMFINENNQVLKKDLEQVKELIISEESKVSSLKGIELFINLERLVVESNYITTLQSIKNLPNLKEVYIKKDDISNLEKVIEFENCPNLKSFKVNDIEYLVNEQSEDDKNQNIKVEEFEKEDVNKDGIVNEEDYNLVTAAYNTTSSSENWNVEYDINQDGIVDLFDLVYISKKLEDNGNLDSKITSFITDKISSQPLGTKIKLLATTNSETNILYEFSVYNNGQWSIIKPYDSNNETYWIPEKSGDYLLKVRTKHMNSTVEYEYESQLAYYIIPQIDNYELYLPKNGTLEVGEVYSPLIKANYVGGEVSYLSPTGLKQSGDVVNVTNEMKVVPLKSGKGIVGGKYNNNELSKEILVTSEQEIRDRLNKFGNLPTDKQNIMSIKITGERIEGGIKISWNEDLPIIKAYEIYRKRDNENFEKVAQIDRDTRNYKSSENIEFLDENVDIDKQYTYKIKVIKIDDKYQELEELLMPAQEVNLPSDEEIVNSELTINSNGEILVDINKPFYIKKDVLDRLGNSLNFKYNDNLKDYDYSKLGIYKYNETGELINETLLNEITTDIQYMAFSKSDEIGQWNINGSTAYLNGEDIKGISIKICDTTSDIQVTYRGHNSKLGWDEWKENGDLSGDFSSESFLNAIEIKLTGNNIGKNIEYRAYIKNEGWQQWKSNGETIGDITSDKSIQAIEIKVVDNDKKVKVDIENNLLKALIKTEGKYILKNREEAQLEIKNPVIIEGNSDDKLDGDSISDDIIMDSKPSEKNVANTLGVGGPISESNPPKFGQTNDEVLKLQLKLLSFGLQLMNGEATSYYGEYTKNAVLAFQKHVFKNSSSMHTGKCDISTVKMINMYTASQNDRDELRRIEENLNSTVQLYPGDEGNTVKVLQDKLIKLGFDLGNGSNSTGYYGNYTVIAIKSIQLEAGYTPDGICNTNTLKKVDEYVSQIYSSNIKDRLQIQYQKALSLIELDPGQEGPLVRKLQQNLVNLGFDLGNGGVPTGYYGQYTQASVLALQMDRWPNDTSMWIGRYGPSTSEMMFGYLNNPASYNKYNVMKQYNIALDSIELDMGMSGELVIRLQSKLVQLGFDLGGDSIPTGYFGKYTEAALLTIQRYTWPSDSDYWVGRYGPSTVKAVNAYVSGKSYNGKTYNKGTVIGIYKNTVLAEMELDPGDEGTAVYVLQARLEKLGFSLAPYGQTGYYGDFTRSAILAIQKVKWPTDSSMWVGRYGPSSRRVLSEMEYEFDRTGTFTGREEMLKKYNSEKYGYSADDTTINKSAMYGRTVSYYSQTDPKWSNYQYSPAGPMWEAGCGPTSMAMVLSTILNNNTLPTDAAKVSMNNGYVVSGGTIDDYFRFMANSNGIQYNNYDRDGLANVKKGLVTGKSLAIAWMQPGHFTQFGHYVVLTGVETIDGQDYFIVYDPNAPNPNYARNGYDGIKLIENNKKTARIKASTKIFASEVKSYHLFTATGQNAPSGPKNPSELDGKDPNENPGFVQDGVTVPIGIVGVDEEYTDLKDGDPSIIFANNGDPFYGIARRLQDRDAQGKYKIWVIPISDDIDAFLEANRGEVNHPAIANLLLDLVPIYGQGKLIFELVTGEQMFTGEDVNRLVTLAGLLTLGMADELIALSKQGITKGPELARKLRKIALKYTDDIAEVIIRVKKAVQTSLDDLSQVITRVYGKFDNALEFEFAGAGKYNIDEKKLIEDADQICRKRYADFIEAKWAESLGDEIDDAAEALMNGQQYTKNERLKVLKGNIKYKSNGYEYGTDVYGRISSAKGELKLQSAPRNEYAQKVVGRIDRQKGIDHGGHLIGSRFGGSGDLDNLVAMHGNLNQGEWAKMENIWAEALDANKKVTVDIDVVYEGTSKRPVEFIIEYVIDGELFKKQFENIAGGGL